MRRWMLVLIGALLVVSIVGAGVWYVAQPPLALFIVPGATDIQVVVLGPGTRLITYQAPGEPCDWYVTVTRTLAANHWQAWFIGGEQTSESEQTPELRPDPLRLRHTHTVALPFSYLWDQAVLDPDPDAEWSVARAPFHCQRSQADTATDHQNEPRLARIVVRRSILPSYWLVDRIRWWRSCCWP
jgi:hypothetical protein